MTEEFLVLGRPPRPPRRGPWAKRGPRIVVVTVLLVLAGWALWHGLKDDPAPPRHDATPPTPSAPATGAGGDVARDPPSIPYIRSGRLIQPNAETVGLPDGSWTNFVVLDDGRLVLVQQSSLMVVGHGQRHSYDVTGGISARPDGTSVAWTGPDGRVRRLDAGRPEPALVHGGRQLVPTCRGIRIDDRLQPGWATCDRDGNLLSPGGGYLASVGSVSVTVAPRDDITGGVSTAFLGTVVDATWEDPYHLLLVTAVADQEDLVRIGVGGESDDLTTIHGVRDRTRPVLVLPATADATSTTAMQP